MMKINQKAIRRIMMEAIERGKKRKNGNLPIRKKTRKKTKKLMKMNMINGKNGKMMKVNQKVIRRTMMEVIEKGIKRKNGNPPVRKKTRKKARKLTKMNGNVWNVRRNVIHWKR